MSPVVRIPHEVYDRLKEIAEPFTDTPVTVIERLLDYYHSNGAGRILSEPSSPSAEVQDSTSAVAAKVRTGVLSEVQESARRPLSTKATAIQPNSRGDEVGEFAESMGAKDLKTAIAGSRLRGLLRRHNYFLLPPDTYLIVKVSRVERVFFGLGEKFVELFDSLTEQKGTYHFVGLDTNHSGWSLSKQRLKQGIGDGSISCSRQEKSEYKINDYNLRAQDRFTSVAEFLKRVKPTD